MANDDGGDLVTGTISIVKIFQSKLSMTSCDLVDGGVAAVCVSDMCVQATNNGPNQ